MEPSHGPGSRLRLVGGVWGVYIVITAPCRVTKPHVWPMKTKLVRIGNSRGVRIPKPLIEQAGLGEDVQIDLTEEGILIRPRSRPRAGWAEAARELEERGEGGLIDEPTPTEFDETEWSWE